MAPSHSAFRWTPKAEKAAALVAADELTDVAIAAEAGTSKRSLERWKTHPEFAARVEALVAEMRKSVLARGVAVVENRVCALDERHRLLRQLVRERAAAPEMQGVPGGSTGLLVRSIKKIVFPKAPPQRAAMAHQSADELLPPAADDCSEADEVVEEEAPTPPDDVTCQGPEPMVFYEAALDTGLLKGMREIEESAARQLGQWLERQEVSGPGGGPLSVDLEEAILKVYGPPPE